MVHGARQAQFLEFRFAADLLHFSLMFNLSLEIKTR